MDRVVFLDRDGTLNEEVHYLYRPRDLRLLPGVGEALGLLRRAGFKLAVITNQSGVARGYYTEDDVKALHLYMNRLLERDNAAIDAFYYCPHHPLHGFGAYKKACGCRKPGTGMFEMACERFDIDKARSFMVGDKRLDVEAGRNFGLIPVLVGTGYGREVHEQDMRTGNPADYDYYADSLLEAARWMVEKAGKGQV